MLSHNDIRQFSMNMNAGKPVSSMPQQGRSIGSQAGVPPSGRRPAKRRSRWIFPLLLVIIALIIATVLAGANLYRGNSTLAVQVTGQQTVPVDLNQGSLISPYLLGSNVFPRTGTSSQDQAKSGFMSYDQPVIVGLRSARIKLLRFPGGDWGEQHTLSTGQLDDFSNLLNQLGAEGIMQVQLSDPLDQTPVPLATRASRAARLVDYMNNKNSIQRLDPKAAFHPIKYWTIGNEPDLLINPDTNKKYTVDEYTQAFIIYSLAMHQKDPSIKILGPEISKAPSQAGPKDASGKLWMEGFLEGIGTYKRTHALPFRLLDGVSFHRYPLDDAQKDAAQLLNEPDQWDSSLPSLRQFIRQQFGEDLPLAITEINTNPGKSVPPPDVAATWWADTLGKLMSNQVEYVSFFSTEGVNTPYPLFTRQGLQETAMLRTMQLFAQLQNNFVPIQAQQGPLSFYATQNEGHTLVSLLFINKTDQSQQIDVHTDSVLPFGPWHGTKLNIPGHGMMVLTLHRGGSNEAYSFSNREDVQQGVPVVQHLVCGGNTGGTSEC
jgi:Glycoside hydrolase family 44